MTARAPAILMMMLSLAATVLLVTAAGVADDVIRLPSDSDEGLDAGGQVVEAEPSHDVCNDQYRGDPRPIRCTTTKNGGEDDEGAAAEQKKDGLVDETRPWACCNNTVCTKSFPPTCHCLDLVDLCAGACQQCERSTLDPFRHVCNDKYHGDPGPSCSSDDVPSGASDRSSPSLAVAAARLLLAFVVLLSI